VQGHALTREAIERLRQRLCTLALDERAGLPCLERGRADLIIPGVAIVQETMASAGADRLVVSDSGLREGLMVELAESMLP
jgi:exopolyphosphatase/guanosine-5'-triphosphate,3'-diphosphate pyrophosphatase